MVELFSHNQKAYESAAVMLAETGKAAIIHPTGTGKSFIGFKCCENGSYQNVCWISPSVYIFETQLENWRNAGGETLNQITFLTYAKLMNMREEEIAEIKPDLIILDEFHRAGAELWGQSVQTLLSFNEDVPVLGFSATAIRYLDNQRNMADELFDGNIASEITLGEAIVRGILNPPKYVLSVFSYRQDLIRYERKVKKQKSKVVRDAAEVYLEALRRALEKADGMDVIFKKHMDHPRGKYLVFTSNKKHMDEMMGYVDDWFTGLDPEPHVYSLYSDDPSADKSFEAFKKDDSDHLRLLYCIDALNEGIHVEGINGVILLRPTISPIIYKQQIGRALTSGCDENAVIFDVVMNIDNLYSIGAIEEEMEIALRLYDACGDHESIVNERFQVFDEVRDCRIAFSRLEETLSASWELMFDKAKEYFCEYGNLEVARRYKTEEGYCLGVWLDTQRKVRSGKIRGNLSESQIRRLDEIGMIWEGHRDYYWERHFEAAKTFYEKNGHLRVENDYVTDSGIRLGEWIARLRSAYRFDYTSHLSQEHIDALNEIGMIWDVYDYAANQAIEACRVYYEVHGDLLFPKNEKVNGIRLGNWIGKMRLHYQNGVLHERLSEAQIQALDDMGMVWCHVSDHFWQQGYAACEAYYAENGHLDVKKDFVTVSGFELGKWIDHQRQVYQRGMDSAQVEKLDALGMIWSVPSFWEKCFTLCEAFYAAHHHLNIEKGTIVQGVDLGRWVNEQRCIANGGRADKSLTDEQVERLNAIGMDWKGFLDRQWDEMFVQAADYVSRNGSLIAIGEKTASDRQLRTWIGHQRAARKKGKLSAEQVRRLDEIGMVWDAMEELWQAAYGRCREYVEEKGNLMVGQDYHCEDGFNLGVWISKQRRAYHQGKLSAGRVQALEKIGMVWDVREALWKQGFVRLKDYFEGHQALPPVSYVMADGYKLGQWSCEQRRKFNGGKMPYEQTKMLNEVGIRF